jgi:hypothetical protein
MSLAIFGPAHSPQRSHLELSPQRRQQIQLTSKPLLLSKIIARKRSGSSLKIMFQQTGAQRLVGDVSTGVIRPIDPAKFRNFFLPFAHFPPWEALLPASCVF